MFVFYASGWGFGAFVMGLFECDFLTWVCSEIYLCIVWGVAVGFWLLVIV